MSGAWLMLIAAGLCEIGWPLGFKVAQTTEKGGLGIALSVACMVLSGWLLYLAQRHIPIGTAYAVWTGIGAAGTFCVGVVMFGDMLSLARVLGAAMIVGGVVVLKIAS